MIKRLTALSLVAFSLLAVNAQTSREEIANNPFWAASNYLAYDNAPTGKNDVLTASPAGYEPFYISHFGRHGSRWLINTDQYNLPLETLRKAKSDGKITPKGEEVLKALEIICATAVNRYGELTEVGERQHHGIGKRMTQRFPEVFSGDDVYVDARSTVVIRCILSMTAECEELAAFNPKMRIHNDVSESFQWYLNAPHDAYLKSMAKPGRKIINDARESNTHPERLMKLLFNDQEYVEANVKASTLMRYLNDISNNMQSHDIVLPVLSEIFTAEEKYDLWKTKNLEWYLNHAAAPATQSKVQYSQENLLRNIIATADTIVSNKKHGATLRFGHEINVMPLAVLMELGNTAVEVEDLSKLEEQWRNYRIYPMACNIQLIFYRPLKGGDGPILVKALLNEREVTLPVDGKTYYKWEDLRKYYLQKLDAFQSEKKATEVR